MSWDKIVKALAAVAGAIAGLFGPWNTMLTILVVVICQLRCIAPEIVTMQILLTMRCWQMMQMRLVGMRIPILQRQVTLPAWQGV